MMKKTLITAAILLPLSANASLSDARSAGMGGVGAASADYMTASFHNPALAAAHTAKDDFGLLLPSVGVRGRDGDSIYDKITTFQDAFEAFEQDPTDPANKEKWQKALKDLDNATIDVDISAGASIAIPNKFVSTNFFTKAEAVTLAIAQVDESDFDIDHPSDKIMSTAHGVSGATLDVGFTFAKEFKISKSLPVKVGISPKFQQLYTINYKNTVEGFDKDDFDFENEFEKTSGFNIDAGVSYNLTKNVRFGFYGKNLIAQDIETNESLGTKATYQVEPEYKAGLAYNSRLYSLALDVDLNERKYFKEYKYSTQSVRAGGELNAWDWAQLRVGYIHSLTDHQDDLITAGIGLKPFGVFGLDLAGQYGKDNNFGASAQMVFQF
ncbi:conjugal transfer protein TraF [Vibrio sp. D431a]|uniref:conjugal transfer protein TraF n=1 Tax=Vibrio sp. D431a TaxID=2837388 RepID=UPI002555AA11|nr:conjugal transfer protein TraF [Vibrio sp. D431a]MDK9789782.1 conjugal transfer protein TraF [Vibrio sp. D431a]